MIARQYIMLLLVFGLLVLGPDIASAASGGDFVDAILNKYRHAGDLWEGPLKRGAVNVFWLLASISLGWTCISMAIKQADLVEIVAELCRFIMVTGLFYWLLLNGNVFATKIIQSLSSLGAQAGNNDGSLHPGALINLGLRVLKMSVDQINILLPAATGIPVAFAIIVLIVCALMAVNMILLLCAAWIVVYAGLVVLGFGGCRWLSDMAINYYRTVLGIGVSLMTMQLVIALGIQFLTQLVESASVKPDVYQLAVVMCATIILAVIAHRLPQIVAGMVLGGGHNGAIGSIGVMTLAAAGMTGMGLAGRLSGNPAAAAAAQGADEGAKMLQDRIEAAEAAMASQPSTSGATTSGSGGSGGGLGGSWGASGASPSGSGSSGASSGKVSPISYPIRSRSGSSSGGGAKTAGSKFLAEPPLERPMSPDEARGFGPDGDGGTDDQPYTPKNGT